MPIDKERRQEVADYSDLAIIKLILEEGQRELLEILYDRYSGKIYRKCLGVVGEKDVAQDLAHDIFIKIFMNLSKFSGRSAFSLWVHSITYNYCMDHLKKRSRLAIRDLEAAGADVPSTAEIELENKILADLQLSQLEQLLEKLRPAEKMILLMRYQDSMSVKQIAASLEMNESTVKMRLKRSRDKLAQLLKETQDGGE